MGLRCFGNRVCSLRPPPTIAVAPLPFFPPGVDLHWHIDAPPADGPTDADRAEFKAIAKQCERDVSDARELCPRWPRRDAVMCLSLCSEAAVQASLRARSPMPSPAPAPAPTTVLPVQRASTTPP